MEGGDSRWEALQGDPEASAGLRKTTNLLGSKKWKPGLVLREKITSSWAHLRTAFWDGWLLSREGAEVP